MCFKKKTIGCHVCNNILLKYTTLPYKMMLYTHPESKCKFCAIGNWKLKLNRVQKNATKNEHEKTNLKNSICVQMEFYNFQSK
jgi:hypothetical protein